MIIIADLLAIILLYNLTMSFKNFRYAIESRDGLPLPDVLRIKIIEEYDSRKNDDRQILIQNLMTNANANSLNKNSKSAFRLKCHKHGPKASECFSTRKKQSLNKTEEVGFYSVEDIILHEDLGVMLNKSNSSWCLESKSTFHLCNSSNDFVKIGSNKVPKINLASRATTEIKAKGTASLKTVKQKNVTLQDALQVPHLRMNFISVRKDTDKGFRVIFGKVVEDAGYIKSKAY